MSQSYMCHSNNGLFYTTAGSFHKRAICKAKFGLLLKKDPGIIQQSYVIQGLGSCSIQQTGSPYAALAADPCICVHVCVWRSNTIQYNTTHCNSRQHTATHSNTLQHNATHCNTLAEGGKKESRKGSFAERGPRKG